MVLIKSRALKLVFKGLADLSGHIFMSLLVSVEMVTTHNLLSILSTGISPYDGIGNVCIWMTDHLAIQNVCFRGKENPSSVALLF